MERSYFSRLAVVMLVSASFLVTGCSTFKSIYRSGSNTAKTISRNVLPGDKPILKKRVLVVPVINLAGFSDQKAGGLTETWLTLLKKDLSLSITPLTGSERSQSAITFSELGVVTDPLQVKKAEEMGMNILVTQVIEPLDYTAQKRGIWPFRTLKGEYEVSVVVNAVDIINGALILSSRETAQIKIGEVPEGQTTPPVLDEGRLNETLNDIQKRQATALLDALGAQEWKGLILLDEGRIKINGGADIGITKGSVFEVFGKGEPIKSVTGKIYNIEGIKLGEISVTEVTGDQAYAVPLDEKIFENGQIIELKAQ
jgi:hypothetical protein